MKRNKTKRVFTIFSGSRNREGTFSEAWPVPCTSPAQPLLKGSNYLNREFSSFIYMADYEAKIAKKNKRLMALHSA